MSLPSDFVPILILFSLAIGFVVATMVLTHIIGRRKHSKIHDENFECGIPSQGNARNPISIKYFLTAILFVLFDVEVIFFYPYAVNFKDLAWTGLFSVGLFVAFFAVGLYYIIKKGALEWE